MGIVKVYVHNVEKKYNKTANLLTKMGMLEYQDALVIQEL